MRRQRFLVCVAMVSTLAACTDWPPPGQGGMAEARNPGYPVEAAKDPVLRSALDRVSVRLACENRRMDALLAASRSQGRLTGGVLAPEDDRTQAEREIAAGLPGDAARSIDRFASDVTALQPDLIRPPAVPAPECPR